MRGTVQTDSFRNAVNKVLSIVDKKNVRPILGYTLVSFKKGQIELSATDVEVSAKICIPAEIEEAGSFCINAKNIFDILRELPEQEFILETNDKENSLNLHCNNIHYNLLIQDCADYPQIAFTHNSNKLKVKAKQVVQIINKTSHAISSDETRIFLNGIYVQEIDSKLRAVATDGHRLSLIDTEIEESENIDALMNGIIIPRKGVIELKKIAETNLDADLTISVDESFIYISLEDQYFLSIRLIAREYPKYQAVIPNKTVFNLTIDKTLIYDAIKRIKIMSNERSNGVRIALKNNEIQLSANHPSLGNATENIPVDYNGKEMEIGFNAKYLMDALSTIDEGDVILEINNELSPVVLKSTAIPDFLGIIMPLKL